MERSRIRFPAWLTVLCVLAAASASPADPPARPRPGQALRVAFHKLAEGGTFDPDGAFAVGTRDTRRGYEAAYVRIPPKGANDKARFVLYSLPTERVVPLAGENYEIRTVPAAPASTMIRDVPPACLSGHRALKRYTNQYFPDGPLSKGVVYAAATTPPGVMLLVHALKEAKPREYGPIADESGRKLQRAVALTTTVNGDALVVGLCDGALVLARVEDVFVDELMALRTRVVREHYKEALKTASRVKSWSLTGIAPHLDRPYNALAVLSDGKVYFGTMPHHPTRGSYVFRYDPAKDTLANLGDLDVLTGCKGPADIPSMMHAPPVEVGGYVFVVGQDPFYGQGNTFPGLPREARYAGSHLMGYDPAKGAFRDFGLVKPGRSAFWLAADRKNGLLYVRTEYDQGPVHRLNVKTGRIERDLVDLASNIILVGAKGSLYYNRKDDLVRFDPAARTEAVIAKGLGTLDWFKGQDGAETAYALSDGAVFRLDTVRDTVQKAGAFSEKLGPGDSAFRNGVVYKASFSGGGQGSNRACRLLTLHLATGKARDHGILVDQDGRIVQAVWALDAASDGTVYLAGPVFPNAGDPYSPRLKRDFLNDDRFMVLRGIKP